jgi:uncharacterized protein (UPF0248 family)
MAEEKRLGRCPIEDKKVQLRLFLRTSEIEKRGGENALRLDLYKYLEIPERDIPRHRVIRVKQ